MADSRAATMRVSLLVYVISAFIFCISTCQERQLVAKVNPGCKSCNDSVVEVIHISATGPNDTLHWVWCFRSKPTVWLALTSHLSNLSLSWDKFPTEARSISFTPEPIYSFGVLVNQFFEYNDVNDTGLLDMKNSSDSYIRRIDVPDSWEMKQFQVNFESIQLVMEGSWKKNGSFVKEGVIKLELETYRKQGHGSMLPHLLHSSNATQMELSMLNMVTDSGFEQGRFVAELVIAADESVTSSVFNSSFKSLDDERTPGVFTVVDLQTNASRDTGNGGYLQWRPVAYVADERDIVNSTETALFPLKNVTKSSSDYEGTLFSAFYFTKLNSTLLNAVNISFGASGDGFYAHNNASIWTVTIGYGHPPDENFSLLVIVIMSTCLGLPAVMILVSLIYIAFRRISYRKDDLFLNE